MRSIIAGLTLPSLCAVAAGAGVDAIDVGGRRELFVDDFLIQEMGGEARLALHRPTRREIVLRTDAPWEGNASGYQSVFKDGDLYRMYYRGGHYRHSGPPAQALPPHAWVLCYAESDDGVNWRRPELGLFEFEGSTANNIILTPESVAGIKGCPAHSAVFKDANPDCPDDARYKAIVVGQPHGMYVLKSGDGLRFSLMTPEPIVTKGAFDSQNLVFWDPVREEYREYHRGFNKGVRDIMTAVSKDIRRFPAPEWLEFPGAPPQHLYTNQIQPYYRAPHIFMGFPMRYNDRGWSEPMMALPQLDERLVRAASHPRYGTTVTDALFMTSRDGLVFKRWNEAFIRPGPQKKDSWVYGDNFIFWGMVETRSHLVEAPNDLSLYVVEGYWRDVFTSVRRYTLRVDGFVSAYAPFSGGEIVTRPIVFDGGNLSLNLETSGAGSLQVEIQDPEGAPIDGYALDDCPEVFGDEIDYVVRWNERCGDVRPLAGRPVRLRFVLKDADLYAFQFKPYAPDPERPDLSKYGGMPKKSADRGPFIVLQDDFQSAEAGTSPTEANLNPPVGDGDKGWLILEGSPDRVQVLNDDPVGSGKPGQRHYLKIERRNEHMAEGGRAWVKFLPQDAADTQNGVVEVSARILVPSSNAYCVDIDAYDNPPNEFGRRAFQVRFFPDGRTTYYQGEAYHNLPDLRIETDAWQDVSIRARMKDAAFDLTVRGRTATDLPFALDDVHRLQSITFAPNTNRCTMYVDEATVKVIP